ncbi:hypothetical protein B0T14DRAFT_518355 [Immersiella caudata]|uniref:Uncharacterized protein n=1 Tax=Immersiella caudata TaxID=314043 RepID=A0AA39WP31_9PEZI|nr:hypothetical protein B0T14DRAFT_518355 [Immersiella caudata]
MSFVDRNEGKIIYPSHVDLEVVSPGVDAPQRAQHTHIYGETAVAPQPRPSSAPEPTARRIFGLHRSTFWLLIVLFLVVIGAAVGGGIGGSIAVEQAKKGVSTPNLAQSTTSGVPSPSTSGSSSSSIAFSTTTGAQPTVTVIGPPNSSAARLPLDCPSINGTKQDVTLGSRTSSFTIVCGGNYIRPEFDIAAIVSYSLTDCLMACASYNWNRQEYPDNLGQRCAAVVFNSNLFKSVAGGFGTCYLKYNKEAFSQTGDMSAATGEL